MKLKVALNALPTTLRKLKQKMKFCLHYICVVAHTRSLLWLQRTLKALSGEVTDSCLNGCLLYAPLNGIMPEDFQVFRNDFSHFKSF